VPRGAAVTGHIRKLDGGSRPARFTVGIEFSAIEWEGARATFYAELADLDRKSAGAVQIEGGIKAAGVFYIDGAGFRLPPGFHMLWRTLARPGGAAQQP
jgi:hypothetical protein